MIQTRCFDRVKSAILLVASINAFLCIDLNAASDSILRIAPDGGVANKFWRFRIKQLRGWWYDPSKSNPGKYNEPDSVALRGIAFFDRNGVRISSKGESDNAVLGDGLVGINANATVFNVLSFNQTSSSNFSQPLGAGSWKVARPDPSDEASWIGLVFNLGEKCKSVGSYRLLTAGDHSDRDPFAWDFSVADSKDGPWQIIENHVEAAVDEFYERLNSAAQVSWDAFNGGYEILFSSGLAIHDGVHTCSNLIGRADLVCGLNSDVRFFCDVSDSERIVKTGTSNVELLGTGAANGVEVSGGSLRLGGYSEGVAQKFWRWRVKKVRGWWYDGSHNEAYAATAVQLRNFALFDAFGNRVNSQEKGTKIKKWINCNDTINRLLYEESDPGNFNQSIGSGSGQVANPSPSDESTWIGFVFQLPDSAGIVCSYNLRTGGDHSDRDPVEWRLEAGDSADGPWTIVDDHREDIKDYIERAKAGLITDDVKTDGKSYGRKSWQVFNCGIVPLRLPYGGAFQDKVCYGSDAVISFAGGGILELPGPMTVTGALDIDCESGGGVLSYFNPAQTGFINLRNLPSDIEFPYSVPLALGHVGDISNLKGWSVRSDGKEKSWVLSVESGWLTISRRSLRVIIR